MDKAAPSRRVASAMAAIGLLATIGACGSLWPILAQPRDPWFNISQSPPDEISFTDRPIVSDIPGKIGHHGATIISLTSGDLLAAWYSFDGPHELDGSAIYMARRPAGGEWSEPWLHIDRPEAEGNPVLYCEGNRVWMFQSVAPAGWSTSRIEFQTSDDGGGTWSVPASIGASPGVNVRFPPVRTPAGLLLPAYDDLLNQSLFFASTDGRTWRLVSRITSSWAFPCIQPALATLDDGRLLAIMRNSGGGWLWASTSRDNGRSWTRPIDSGFVNPNAPAALLRLHDGRLLMVHNAHDSERLDLAVTTSSDDGVTWSKPSVLVPGPPAVIYPNVAQSPDGHVHVVYTYGKVEIRHIEIVLRR